MHAWLYDRVCGWFEERGVLDLRRVLVSDLTNTVVELGTGTGRNFHLYPPDCWVIASDLDLIMLKRARTRVAGTRARISLLAADAMRVPLADHSAQTVVISGVLCTVSKPDSCLQEIRRILKPGGEFRFLEHVRDEDGTVRSRIQDALTPSWRCLSGGCNANRRSVATIAEAGFHIKELRTINIGWTPLAPHVVGTATTSP